MSTSLKLCYVLLGLFLMGCYGPDPAHYGTKTVATRGCIDPQTAYHASNVSALGQLGLSAWRPQTDLSQMPDYETLCEDFTEGCEHHSPLPMCGNQAGYYTLGTSVVHVDPARANGEFAFSAVENHELTHADIAQGPHPERARLHICDCGIKSPECWDGGCGGDNLMSPGKPGLGTTTATMWDGNTESVDVGMIPQNTPTDLDRKFVRWAKGL